MIKLHGRSKNRWQGEPFVCRISDNPLLPEVLREREAFLGSDTSTLPAGFHCYLIVGADAEKPRGTTSTPRILTLPKELEYLRGGDIVRVNPESGDIRALYRKTSPSNALFVTKRCNCNCIMCPQPPVEAHDLHLLNDCLAAVPLMDRSTPLLGITGGEPTLCGDGLLQLVLRCKQYLPNTAIHLLSNGRFFSYLTFCQAMSRIQHPNLMVCVSLHSDLPEHHDFVAQAEGAFDQTVRGIMNLKRCGLRVELRVVLHRLSAARLPHVIRFIVRNLPVVDHVALMGLETVGYGRTNLQALWIDPFEYRADLAAAVAELSQHGLYASVFNHPLCVLERSVWDYARKSISDWKTEYVAACVGCAERHRCGGFFAASELKQNAHIKPIPELES